MCDHSAENVVRNLVGSLDQKVWEGVAAKKVAAMAPRAMANHADTMFDDFTIMVAAAQTKQNIIKQVPDHNRTFKQNYILGTAKIIERSVRSYSDRHSQPAIKTQTNFHARNRQHIRAKTQTNLPASTNQTKAQNQGKTKSHFFQLTHQSPNREEQKLDNKYRQTKYSDIQYIINMEEARKDLQQKRAHRTFVQAKRFKQMKQFTYDFEGKLLSTGQQKAEDSLQVITMQPNFTSEVKSKSIDPSRKSSSKLGYILDKKLINLEKTPYIDPHQQKLKKKKEQEHQQEIRKRKDSFMKNTSNLKFNNLFNKDTRVAIGVSITDMENSEKVTGKERNKSDTRLLKLKEFKQFTKQIEYFPTRRNLKVRKIGLQLRTEGNEPLDTFPEDSQQPRTQPNRIKAWTDKSKASSFFRKTARGTIHINHPSLYSQNFSPLKSQ